MVKLSINLRLLLFGEVKSPCCSSDSGSCGLGGLCKDCTTVSIGDREQRVKEALGTMGASVFSGITLTKLVGVIVLCFSRTEVLVVYYFQMYLALVLLGFLHGLVFLPVFEHFRSTIKM